MADLKGKRLDLGLTQAKIAQLMGVHEQLWVKWERGEQRLTAAPARLLELLLLLQKEHPGIFKKLLKRYL